MRLSELEMLQRLRGDSPHARAASAEPSGDSPVLNNDNAARRSSSVLALSYPSEHHPRALPRVLPRSASAMRVPSASSSSRRRVLRRAVDDCAACDERPPRPEFVVDGAVRLQPEGRASDSVLDVGGGLDFCAARPHRHGSNDRHHRVACGAAGNGLRRMALPTADDVPTDRLVAQLPTLRAALALLPPAGDTYRKLQLRLCDYERELARRGVRVAAIPAHVPQSRRTLP